MAIRSIDVKGEQARTGRGSRRKFLQGAGSLAAIPSLTAAKSKSSAAGNIYAELGVRTVINGRGVATFYSGSLMPPEVHRAMERASEHFVEIVELQKAVGARLARYAERNPQWCAAARPPVYHRPTAGCIAGTDIDKIGRLPDTTGMK